MILRIKEEETCLTLQEHDDCDGRPRKRWANESEEDLKINGNQKLVQSGQRAERVEEK